MKYLLPLLLLSAFALAQDGKPEEKTEPTPEAKPEEKKPEEKKPEEKKDETKPVAPANTNPVVIMKTSMGDIEIELFADQAPKTVENFVGLAEGTKEFTDVKTNQKVTRPFYDGIAFHRVIDKFMVQGGCPLGTGSGSPGFKFEDEINAKGLGLDKMMAIVNGGPHQYLGIRSQQDFNQKIIGPILRKLGIKGQAELDKRKEEANKAPKELTLMTAYENMGYKYSESGSAHKPNRGMLAMANSGPNTNGSQFFINLVDTPWLTGKHTVFGKVVKGMEIVDTIGKVKVGAGSKPVEPVTIVSIRLKKAES